MIVDWGYLDYEQALEKASAANHAQQASVYRGLINGALVVGGVLLLLRFWR